MDAVFCAITDQRRSMDSDFLTDSDSSTSSTSSTSSASDSDIIFISAQNWLRTPETLQVITSRKIKCGYDADIEIVAESYKKLMQTRTIIPQHLLVPLLKYAFDMARADMLSKRSYEYIMSHRAFVFYNTFLVDKDTLSAGTYRNYLECVDWAMYARHVFLPIKPHMFMCTLNVYAECYDGTHIAMTGVDYYVYRQLRGTYTISKKGAGAPRDSRDRHNHTQFKLVTFLPQLRTHVFIKKTGTVIVRFNNDGTAERREIAHLTLDITHMYQFS